MKHRSAERYLAAVKGLTIHGISYLAASIVMVIINLLTGGPLWCIFPILGWGIGLSIHALAVLGTPRLFSREMEERIKENWNQEQSDQSRR